MCVPPLSEMSLERFGSFVGEVAADLAVVRGVEAVKLVQPVGNRLPVPTKRQVLRVVGDVIVFLLVEKVHDE